MSFETVIIGPCTLIRGDCLEVLPTLSPGSVDAVVTDPPYGVGFSRYESHDDDPEQYETLIAPAVSCCNEALADGGMAFVWQGMKNADRWHRWFPPGYRIFAALRNFTQFLPTPLQYSFDPVVWWVKGKSSRRSVAGQRDYCIGNTARYVSEESNGHPCPRPLDTVEYVVQCASSHGETVLDPFMGSGTTGVACIKTGRNFIGIELEQKYFDIACERIRKAWKLERSKLRFEPQPVMRQQELIAT